MMIVWQIASTEVKQHKFDSYTGTSSLLKVKLHSGGDSRVFQFPSVSSVKR